VSEGTSRAATLRPHVFDAEEVASRLALQHLATAYCHAVDRRDYALLATLYHEDAIDDHSPYYCGPAAGYVAWLPTMMANWSATAHRIDTTLYLIDGDHAEGELRATAWHRTLDGFRDFVAHGRYVDQYRRRDGVWRFQKRAFILDWSEERSVISGDDFGAAGVAIGHPNAQDPVYDFLPMMAADRAARTSAT
jgi:hypothetical protein